MEQVNELCERQCLDAARRCPIGLGLPGMMRRDGHLAFAPNLQTASGADLGALLGSALGNSSVFCENDANCAALAEHEWGAAARHTGLRDGDPRHRHWRRRRRGWSTHSRAKRLRRRDRSHGRRGARRGRVSVEVVAAGSATPRVVVCIDSRARPLSRVDFRRWSRAAREILRAVRAEDVPTAAAEGLDEAVALMREVGWWLALGLANLAAILDCGHFVIGGGLSSASELVLPAAREYLVDLVEGYDVEPDDHGHDVDSSASVPGAMGAALVAFEGA